MEKKRTQCYFDVEIEQVNVGRIVFSLWKDLVPKTVENFRTLCTGEKGVSKSGHKLCYQGSIIHRVVRDFMVQGGDFTKFNGTGGESIYGGRFEDEDLTFEHSRAGLLSMANAGPNTNGSQFFITCAPASHLNGLHVIFGEVVQGMKVLRHIENEPTVVSNNYRPVSTVKIVACGELAENEHVTPEEIPELLEEEGERWQRAQHDADSSSPMRSVDASRHRTKSSHEQMHGDRRQEHSPRVRIDSKGRIVKGRGNIGRGSQCMPLSNERRRNGYRERRYYRVRPRDNGSYGRSSPRDNGDSLSPPPFQKKRWRYAASSPDGADDRSSQHAPRDDEFVSDKQQQQQQQPAPLRNTRQLVNYDMASASDAPTDCLDSSMRRTSRSSSPPARRDDGHE